MILQGLENHTGPNVLDVLRVLVVLYPALLNLVDQSLTSGRNSLQGEVNILFRLTYLFAHRVLSLTPYLRLPVKNAESLAPVQQYSGRG